MDTQKKLIVPAGSLAVEESADAAARKRRELKEMAEQIKRGEDIFVMPSGQLATQNYSGAEFGKSLKIADGKFGAGFYWYERDPELFKAEKQAMNKYFPAFKLDKLDDGRLCWSGTLQPLGKGGGGWMLMAVYDNNHPNNNTYGGSLKIYSADPDLNELSQEAARDKGKPLPHALADSSGNLYICTARKEDVDDGKKHVTSAAKSLTWAAKWTYCVELWLLGIIGDEIFEHVF